MDYCDVFISCLDTHSDGTHSKSVLMKKQTHLHLDGLRMCKFVSKYLFFWSTIPLTFKQIC